MFLELLGLTPEQIAKGETWSPEDGERTRDTGDKIGDKVMSILTGTDYAAEVEKQTKENYRKKMQNRFGTELEDVKDVKGYQDIGDLTKLTPQQITSAIEKRVGTRDARSSYTALTGEEVDDYTITDPGTIKSKATRTLKDEETAEVKRQEGRADDLLALQLQLSREDRAEDRAIRRENRAFENRKLDLQEARLDRKDRQAAIQQMMAGLAQLGASIAI